MKAGTMEKFKFQKLKRTLRLPQYAVAGLLESLWYVTARDAPQGNIGRFDNVSIAIMLDWEGDADELISALVETGWLDEHESERLVIHGWSEHCPRYVKGNMRRHQKELYGESAPDIEDFSSKEAPIGSSSEEAPIGSSSREHPKPSQVKSSQVKSSQSFERLGVRSIDVVVIRKDCTRLVEDIDPPSERRQPLKARDHEFVVRSIIAKWRIAKLNPHEIGEAIRQRRREGNGPKRPWAYYRGAIKKRCEELGVDMHQVIDTIEIPEELKPKSEATP